MTVSVTAVTPRRIVIWGGRGVPGIFALARRWAAATQAEKAIQFDAEGAFGGLLKRNSAAWNRYKAKHGFDPRRGHMTGQLQAAMENVQCWRVTPYGKDNVQIIFTDAFLRSVAPYADFYIAAKTRRGYVMAVTKAELVPLAGDVRTLVRKSEAARGERTAVAQPLPPAVQPPPRVPTVVSDRRIRAALRAPRLRITGGGLRTQVSFG